MIYPSHALTSYTALPSRFFPRFPRSGFQLDIFLHLKWSYNKCIKLMKVDTILNALTTRGSMCIDKPVWRKH